MKKYEMRAWDCFNAEFIYSKDYQKWSLFFAECEKRIRGGNTIVYLAGSSQPDVNGVNMYEGDIISFKQFNPNSKMDEDWIAELYWDEGNCALRIRTKTVLRGFLPVQEPTIIGDMFRTPEKFV